MLLNRERWAFLGAQDGFRQGTDPCATQAALGNGMTMVSAGCLIFLCVVSAAPFTFLSYLSLSFLPGTCPFAQNREPRDHHLCPQPWAGTRCMQKKRESVTGMCWSERNLWMWVSGTAGQRVRTSCDGDYGKALLEVTNVMGVTCQSQPNICTLH